MNTLYYGDCLSIMRERMAADSVDLVYLDPPFNSRRDYSAIYRDETGRPLPDQVAAFNDTWVLDAERMRTIRHLALLFGRYESTGPGADLLAGFLSSLAHTQPDMAAYLAYMTERLVEIRRVMKPTGSIYLHCDPTASHYLKIVMDVIFGNASFQNEFVWHYSGGGASRKRWARKHDILLFYTYGKEWTFNVDAVRTPHKWDKGQKRADGSERDYSKGKIPDDVWRHHSLMPWSSERMGYPTQKPVALLDRIVKASSNPGDLVFDPFCGCATTIEAAEVNGRKWIGIDITIHAIKRVAQRRLGERLHLVQGEDYVIEGLPRDLEGAQELWRQDPYQFQKWCVEQVEGFVNAKGSAGRVYFDMPGEKVLQSMALEVKGGESVSINDARALGSVLGYENVRMAGLILLREPDARQKKSFLAAMALAGEIEIAGVSYPRIQLLTVAEMLQGGRFDMPRPVGRGDSGYDTDLFSHGGV